MIKEFKYFARVKAEESLVPNQKRMNKDTHTLQFINGETIVCTWGEQ